MDGNQFRISFSTNMFHSLASESQILDHVFIQIRNHSFINSANNHEKTKYLCFSDVLMILEYSIHSTIVLISQCDYSDITR